MNKIDFASINAALDGETCVPQWLTGGFKRGPEWVAANPTRGDRTPGSFSVNMRTGVWKDFATGEGGADLVSLYAYLFCQGDQGAAARELAANRGIKIAANDPRPDVPVVRKLDDAKPVPLIPVPADAPMCTDFKHPTHGDASMVWTYRDLDSKLMFYVCRFDPADGSRKQISPRSWCAHPGKASRWTWRGITGKGKRPLYGLDRLTAKPDATVLMVEGEKAADAGDELLGDEYAVLSWMGGTETADRADVAPLAGRRVILFTDWDAQRHKLTVEETEQGIDPASKPIMPKHEQPGFKAMMHLARNLKGIATDTLLVDYAISEETAGWDIADALAEGWTGDQLQAYIKENAGDPWFIASGKKQRAAEPPPANDNTPRVGLDYEINILGFPHRSDKDMPKNTVENLEYLFEEYGITAKYNETRKNVELVLPGRKYSLDNRANCALAELTSICVRNHMPQSMLSDYVKLIADRNAYNPVREWIDSKPWDGVSRLKALYNTITIKGDPAMRDMLLYRWLLSCVAAIYMPFGFESHGVLVFTGDQGQGKTKWVKRLAPPEMDVVLAGAVLDPNNKDTITTAVGHWLVELGELDATFRKADVARLKAFITNSVDKLRRPYDRVESEYQRRTVFFASVNKPKYLVDDTGNRRWWTIAAIMVNYEHDIDMQQVWAELLTHYLKGERWYLTREEQAMLSDVNEEHEQTDPVEEQILAAFDWDKPSIQGHKMTASEVLIAIGYDKPTKAQATDASEILRRLTGKDPHRTAKGRYFEMPSAPKRRQSAERPAPYPTNDRDDGPF